MTPNILSIKFWIHNEQWTKNDWRTQIERFFYPRNCSSIFNFYISIYDCFDICISMASLEPFPTNWVKCIIAYGDIHLWTLDYCNCIQLHRYCNHFSDDWVIFKTCLWFKWFRYITIFVHFISGKRMIVLFQKKGCFCIELFFKRTHFGVI